MEIVTGVSYAIARYVAASGLAAVISISGFLRLNVDYPLTPLNSATSKTWVKVKSCLGDAELETWC